MVECLPVVRGEESRRVAGLLRHKDVLLAYNRPLMVWQAPSTMGLNRSRGGTWYDGIVTASDPFDIADYAPSTSGSSGHGEAPARPYLEHLNEVQREAVETIEGPLLVLAGAGTGKTRVLTTRIAHILHRQLAWPSQILAVTFTNKASRQMQDRVAALVGGSIEGMWLGTFHANGVRILRRHAELVGLKSSFTILGTDDQLRLLKQLLQTANIDEKRWPSRALAGIIDRWKDKGLRPEQVKPGDAGEFAMGKSLELYEAYQARLRALNAVDFGDLLLHCLTLFTATPDLLAEYQRRFKYILVDEYQDTNVAQYLWLRLLAQERRNLCCVGDDDQSIYGWRGAEVGNILRFEHDFPGARVIRLERNYRSTPHILACASDLIAHNEGRLGKTLWTDGDEGEKISVRGLWDADEEARVVGEEIEALQRRGQALNEIAILVRASFQTREFEDRFLTFDIPYRIIGGVGFYERQEIRDAIAYLRVVRQPDDDLAFERIANVPKRGIGDATMRLLHRLGRAEGRSLYDAAWSLTETDEIRPQACRALRGLLDSFARWRGMVDNTALPRLVEIVLDESGYTEKWQRAGTVDAPGRLDNLKELVAATEEFETLTAFYDHVSLVMDNEANASGDAVNLVTLHGAKGLEFDAVFLPGWEEGLFPHQRALDQSGTAGLEEERRLAHVGLTRARKRIYVSYAASRRIYNSWQSSVPSRFVDELPAEHINHVSELGLYGRSVRGPEEQTVERPAMGRRASRYRPVTPAGLVHEDRHRGQEFTDEPSGEFKAGMRVFHQKFGYGHIAAVDGNRLQIDFEKAGSKRVIDSFVELT